MPRFFRRLFLGLLILVAVLTATFSTLQRAQAQDPELSAELWAETEAFRIVASYDLLFALETSATPEARIKFAELATLLWPDRPEPEAWSAFFRYALVNFVAGNYEVETVLFQHPWADVVLLTGWSKSPADGQWQLVDLGIAMGSVLRGAAEPFVVGRGWLTSDRFAPEAVAELNAETSKAIIAAEAGEADNPLARLDADQTEAMIVGAAVQLLEHQVAILPLLFDEPGIARAMRFGWNEIMAAAQQGRLEEVLPPSAPVAALSSLEPAFWDSLEPVAYLESTTGAVAMFASWRNPDIYAAFRFRGDGETGEITDFDLYSFSGQLTRDVP